MGNLIESLNYDRYQRLITGYFTHPFSVVAYDDMGMVFWHSAGCSTHKTYTHPAEIITNGTRKYSDDAIKWIVLSGNTHCYLIEVHDINEELIATIGVFFSNQDAEDECSLMTRIAPSIAALRQLIQSEYELNTELDSMAGELADRHDELNMVYTTVDDIQSRAEAGIALAGLVKNCSAYMGVPLSALIVPQCNINIHYQNKNDTFDNLDSVLAYIENTLLYQTNNTTEPVILNTDEDYASEGLERMVEGKFIAIPVMTKGGVEHSILACYKPKTEHEFDFTNSDKNLLMTMVRKVTKILNASFDSMTGLMSRQAFEFSTESAVRFAKQEQNVSAILYINIDKVQIINDMAGHLAGDVVIKQVASAISTLLKDVEIVARIGGDIFGVLIDNCSSEEAETIAENIRLILNKRFSWNRDQFDISISIGVCEINEHTVSATSAITAAEVSCDAAKELGRNQVVVYNDNNALVQERKGAMHWVHRIQAALRGHKFCLFAQPIEMLNGSPEAFHFEILLRMHDHDGGILSPGAFMHAAELYNMMPELDEYVIKTAISTFEPYWDLLNDKNGSIAINLSGQSIRKSGFLDFILNQVGNSTLPANVFCFEVTETAALGCIDEAKHFIQQIKKIGCKFSLDDFGTGMSSFNYLKLLPVDYLKIDGSFVSEIINDPINDEMVRAINRIGHVMNLKTIAEFVEDKEIMDHLREIGIDYGQGFHIGKPIPFEQRLEMLTDRR